MTGQLKQKGTSLMNRMIGLIVASMAACILAGCGGGGGGGTSTPAPSTQSPAPAGTLTLALSGEQQVRIGTSFDNPATSSLGRQVTYTSSDPNVARVGANGRVDAFGTGTATITAAESVAGGRTVTYTVRVMPAELRGRLVDGTTFSSTHTGIAYPYSVYLPAGYDGSAKRYPVMYMTDGQWATNLYQIADRKGKEVILVIIHQGPENRRMTDYLPPGAAAYARFLKQEMIPLIETTYRTSRDRAFYGASAGGTLGAILLADEPIGEPYFRHYILADGAFWALTPQTAQAEIARHASSPVLDVNIFLTGTNKGNLPGVLSFASRYNARNYQGLTLSVVEHNTLTHEEMSDPTFTEAMDRFF